MAGFFDELYTILRLDPQSYFLFVSLWVQIETLGSYQNSGKGVINPLTCFYMSVIQYFKIEINSRFGRDSGILWFVAEVKSLIHQTLMQPLILKKSIEDLDLPEEVKKFMRKHQLLSLGSLLEIKKTELLQMEGFSYHLI